MSERDDVAVIAEALELLRRMMEADFGDASLVDPAHAALASLSLRLQNAETALARLVRLKDGPRDDAYREQKEAAWTHARTALASSSEREPA